MRSEQGPPMPAFGENLRREREMRGVSLEEISSATKISLRFLEAIEREDFAKLPGGIFSRSFIRTYARYLGLDEERVVAEFQLAAQPQTDFDLHRMAAGNASCRPAGGTNSADCHGGRGGSAGGGLCAFPLFATSRRELRRRPRPPGCDAQAGCPSDRQSLHASGDATAVPGANPAAGGVTPGPLPPGTPAASGATPNPPGGTGGRCKSRGTVQPANGDSAGIQARCRYRLGAASGGDGTRLGGRGCGRQDGAPARAESQRSANPEGAQVFRRDDGKRASRYSHLERRDAETLGPARRGEVRPS